MALGFGQIQGVTSLGHPLNFSVVVRFEAGEELDSTCVAAAVASGERPLTANTIQARFDSAHPGSSERVLRVTTFTPIDEPVVLIDLKVGCPPHLARSFIVFADPPRANDVASVQPPQEPERVVSPLLSAAQALAHDHPAVPPSALASRRKPPRLDAATQAAAQVLPSRRSVVAAAESSRAEARRAAQAPSVSKPTRGPVLRLDAIEAEAKVVPSLEMSSALAQVPDPSASSSAARYTDPDVERHRVELERLRQMESSLQSLRQQGIATQKLLADMQERLRDAEAGRYANPLVYALAGLCGVLAVALAVMFWLRRRDRLSAGWWVPPDASGGPAPEAAAAEPVGGPSAPSHFTSDLNDAQEAPGAGLRRFSASTPLRPPIVTAGTPAAQPAPDLQPLELNGDDLRTSALTSASASGARSQPPSSLTFDLESGIGEPRRPMSAEELIDLEQQAEFFVVLGQDDAAIDLLMGHVRSTGGVSPLPYMKLLEIYRRREEREPYDRIRERFNRRFNAYAPEWGVDPEQGLDIEGYPEICQRLQNAWPRPQHAMDMLDAALFKRDAGPVFDVPAYRELLFLYGIARDLAEHDTSPQEIDLLLPFNEEPTLAALSESEETAAEKTLPLPQISEMGKMGEIASQPAPEAKEDLHFSLDLDVSSDPMPMPVLTLVETDDDRPKR